MGTFAQAEVSDLCLCKQLSHGLLRRPDGCVKWAGRRREPGAHVLFIVGNLQYSLKLNKLARQDTKQRVRHAERRGGGLSFIQ